MPDYLYLDIETLPTTNAVEQEEIAASITAPGNITKTESIAAWETEKKPALVAEAIAKTSFNGALGSICCVGFAWNNDKPMSCILSETGEASMFRLALSEIEQARPNNRGVYHQTTIVGHYVADFDLRFMWQRAFVLGVRMPHWFPRDPKPWSKEVHDTMQMWAGTKGTISLDNLCKALGVKGKDGMDGSMVAEAWRNGEYERVGAYCADDVERVRQVHRKMLVAMGDVE